MNTSKENTVPWSRKVEKHDGWPWVFYREDGRIAIFAPHQTPFIRRYEDIFVIVPALIGLYYIRTIKVALLPLVAEFKTGTPEEVSGFAALASFGVIALIAVIIRYLVFPVLFRKPLIIIMGPEHLRIGSMFWFKKYSRQWIGGFSREQHSKTKLEQRKNADRQKQGHKPRFHYGDSVHLLMEYNNVPVVIASIYGEENGRTLLGRIQAVYGEAITPSDKRSHDTGKY